MKARRTGVEREIVNNSRLLDVEGRRYNLRMERDGARGALVVLLVLYAVSRVLQIFPTQVPTLPIVVLHVAPPALFAVIHGWRVYGAKGICCSSRYVWRRGVSLRASVCGPGFRLGTTRLPA
jgi:hypothetical protein